MFPMAGENLPGPTRHAVQACPHALHVTSICSTPVRALSLEPIFFLRVCCHLTFAIVKPEFVVMVTLYQSGPGSTTCLGISGPFPETPESRIRFLMEDLQCRALTYL